MKCVKWAERIARHSRSSTKMYNWEEDQSRDMKVQSQHGTGAFYHGHSTARILRVTPNFENISSGDRSHSFLWHHTKSCLQKVIRSTKSTPQIKTSQHAIYWWTRLPRFDRHDHDINLGRSRSLSYVSSFMQYFDRPYYSSAAISRQGTTWHVLPLSGILRRDFFMSAFRILRILICRQNSFITIRSQARSLESIFNAWVNTQSVRRLGLKFHDLAYSI